jgi:hypothetical protein
VLGDVLTPAPPGLTLSAAELRAVHSLVARIDTRFGGDLILGASSADVAALAATAAERGLIRRLLALRPDQAGVATPAVPGRGPRPRQPVADIDVAALIRGDLPGGLPRHSVVRLIGQSYFSQRLGRRRELRPLLVASTLLPHLAALQRAACAELGRPLLVMSQYRSPGHQLAVILRELDARGGSLEQVLRRVALPGYSQHGDLEHPAVDFATDDGRVGDEFRGTADHAWLLANAGRFGLTLSYPDGNPWAIDPEPWHWQLTHRGQGD